MNRRTKFLAFGCTVAVASVACVAAAMVMRGRNAQVFSGQYDWDGGSDELKVTFFPAGNDVWSAEFTFQSGGTEDTWDGTAQGSLEDGTDLLGTVTWEKRVYDYEAAIADGTLSGTHSRMIGGNRVVTGSFVIDRQGPPMN